MTVSLFVFLFFTILIPYIKFKFSDNNSDINRYNKIKIIGHRGASKFAPENTMSSFKLAMNSDADMLELDVHLSKDDSLVVIHDNTLNRTTNGKGKINEFTLNEIKKLDAGSFFNSDFKGEEIPALSEVFELVNGKKVILIELKWPKSGIYPNLVPNLITLIRKYKAERWVVIQSFETMYLNQIELLAPDLICHQLVFGFSSFLPIYFDRTFHFGKFKYSKFIKSINCFYLYANKEMLEHYHDQKLSVYVFTIDDADLMLRAAKMGIDGIITNDPELALKTLR